MRTLLRLFVLTTLAGCTATGPTPHAVPTDADGKLDNYVSTNAREFVMSGHSHVTLPDGFDMLTPEAQASQLDTLVQRRLNTVSRAVQSHITAVVREANGGETGEETEWFTYFRRGNAESEAPEVLADGRARFGFQMELVGSLELAGQLVDEASGLRGFEVEVKDYSETVGEMVEVTLEASPSRDAFPQYDALFADGVYDIGVHFGGDYNEERFDIETARWLVETLLSEGWTNTAVTDFDSLEIDSPPFVTTLLIEGREVEGRVFITHSDMVEADNEEPLAEAMRESFRTRDVVIYSGHAGEGAGFILDYQPRFEISASDFAALEMRDSYQIFVLDGCQTYRSYVDDLLENPNKSLENVDIVTTVNTTPFSVGYQTLHEFINWFTLTDDAGNHFPLTWNQILSGVNTEEFDSVHYGVHGVDFDPQLNPHASEGIACQPCSTDTDCGAGGNYCLQLQGGNRCGVACTTDEACGAGASCATVFEGEEAWYLPRQCVPSSLTCG